jgi:hypothetical protein
VSWWTEWGRSALNVVKHHPIGWDARWNKKAVWSQDAFLLSWHIRTPGSVGFTPVLLPQPWILEPSVSD